jgi:hypothetical protein
MNGITETIYFTPENAKFYRTKGGLVGLEAFIPPVGKDDLSEEETDNSPVWQDLGRVFLHRAFPYDMPNRFISVLDKDGKEYGMIKDVSLFCGEALDVIQGELKRKYYCPVITKVTTVTAKFGYTYWEAESDMGKLSFSMHDTYRNIAKVGGNRLVLTDVDGNRYEIKDYLALDRKSFRKIELYL